MGNDMYPKIVVVLQGNFKESYIYYILWYQISWNALNYSKENETDIFSRIL